MTKDQQIVYDLSELFDKAHSLNVILENFILDAERLIGETALSNGEITNELVLGFRYLMDKLETDKVIKLANELGIMKYKAIIYLSQSGYDQFTDLVGIAKDQKIDFIQPISKPILNNLESFVDEINSKIRTMKEK